MQKMNDLRKQLGMSELLVSHFTMAAAQKNMNNAYVSKDHSLSTEFQGEILVAYPYAVKDVDPFDLWYTNEEVLYKDTIEKLMKENGMSEEEATKEANKYQTAEANGYGHYWIIKIGGAGYNMMGYACIEKDLGENGLGIAHICDFFNTETIGIAGPVDYDPSKVTGYDTGCWAVSIDEYAKKFQEFLNYLDIDGKKSAMETAGEEYNNTLTQYNNLTITRSLNEESIKAGDDRIAEYERQKQMVKDAQDGLKANLEFFQGLKAPTEERIASETANLETLKAQREAINADIAALEKEIADAKANAEAAGTAVTEANKTVAEKEAAVKAAQKALDDYTNSIGSRLEEKKAELEAAKKKTAEAEAAKADADAALAEAKNVYAASVSEKDRAKDAAQKVKEAYEQARTATEEKKGDLDAAKAALEKEQADQDAYLAAKAAYDQAKEAYDAAKAAEASAETASAEAAGTLADAEEKLADARTAKEAADRKESEAYVTFNEAALAEKQAENAYEAAKNACDSTSAELEKLKELKANRDALKEAADQAEAAYEEAVQVQTEKADACAKAESAWKKAKEAAEAAERAKTQADTELTDLKAAKDAKDAAEAKVAEAEKNLADAKADTKKAEDALAEAEEALKAAEEDARKVNGFSLDAFDDPCSTTDEEIDAYYGSHTALAEKAKAYVAAYKNRDSLHHNLVLADDALEEAQNAYDEANKAYIEAEAEYQLAKADVWNFIMKDVKIIEGADGTWTLESTGEYKIVSNGEFPRFLDLWIDGSLVDASNYRVEEGSTEVYVKADFMNNLSEGVHTIVLRFSDDRQTEAAHVTVKKAAQTPGTPEDPETPSKPAAPSTPSTGGNKGGSTGGTTSTSSTSGSQTTAGGVATGDPSSVTLFGSLFAVSGIAGLFTGRRKKRNNQED